MGDGVVPGATAERSWERTAVPSYSRWGDAGNWLSGKGSLQPGVGPVQGTLPSGGGGIRGGSSLLQEALGGAGDPPGCGELRPLQYYSPLGFTQADTQGSHFYTVCRLGQKKGMNLRTKSEMLFPGCEKSGLVTPNSTDCAIPKGLAWGWGGGLTSEWKGSGRGRVLLRCLAQEFCSKPSLGVSWPWAPVFPLSTINKALALVSWPVNGWRCDTHHPLCPRGRGHGTQDLGHATPQASLLMW